MSLKSYGEFNLIRRIRDRVQASHPDVVIGIGDDTAAIRPTPGMLMLPTTDTFVEGLDFDLDFSTWFHIGWKSLAANLSDVAAMGGVPRYALVTLCLPDDRAIEDVDAFCDGMVQLAERFGALIIGGDLSGMPGPATVSITLIGEALPDRVIRRTGAQVGDMICVTGDLGASDAGLRLLGHVRRHPGDGAWLKRYAVTVDKHRAPVPRVHEARILADSGAVHAMIDISDGLSSDVRHMGHGVGISIDTGTLPITRETRDTARALDIVSTDLALHSGEEFELLCSVDRTEASGLCRRVTEATGTPMTIIGEITPEASGYSWHDDTGIYPLVSGGYDHFGEQ